MSVDVGDILAKAWAEVERAGLPSDLHETAFREAVRMLSSGSTRTDDAGVRRTAARSPNPNGKRSKTAQRPATSDAQSVIAIDESEFFEKVERETGVSRDAVEQVVYLDNGVPRINMPARRLGPNLKVRQQTVAQLIPVVRHFGLDEAETSTRVVREECARLKCLDEKNINLYLGRLDGIVYTGPRDGKVLRVRPGAVGVFERRIKELLAGDGGADE